MTHNEAVREALLRTTANLSCITEMLEELEDFDEIVEHPIWGTLQNKLIGLRDEYQIASEVLYNAPAETTGDFEEILQTVTDQVKTELTNLLLTTNSRNISIQVEVLPTLH